VGLESETDDEFVDIFLDSDFVPTAGRLLPAFAGFNDSLLSFVAFFALLVGRLRVPIK